MLYCFLRCSISIYCCHQQRLFFACKCKQTWIYLYRFCVPKTITQVWHTVQFTVYTSISSKIEPMKLRSKLGILIFELPTPYLNFIGEDVSSYRPWDFAVLHKEPAACSLSLREMPDSNRDCLPMSHHISKHEDYKTLQFYLKVTTTCIRWVTTNILFLVLLTKQFDEY